MYKIAKDNLAALFQLIADKQELYLPVKNAGQTNYAAWTEEAEVDLDTLKTVKSAKDAFFPQSENLYTVKKENKKLKIHCRIRHKTEMRMKYSKIQKQTKEFLPVPR